MAIFRKVALERLSSPEQLDQLLQVTSPKGWMALLTFGVMIIAAISWGVFGSLPTEALGQGILIRQGGVSDVVAVGGGQVESVLVNVGDVVEKGQEVVKIQQQAILRQIDETQARQAALEAEYEDLLRYAEEQRKLSASDLAQQRANFEQSIATLENEVELLRERVSAEEALLDDGLITRQTLLRTEQQLNTTRDRLANARLQLNGLELKRLEAEQRLDQQIETQRTQLRNLELEMRELNARLTENVQVVSPYSGRVLELMVSRGDLITPGTPVLSLELDAEELMAVLFVPASSGKQVQVGMEARISPSTVKRERYGYIVGEVTWVASFPATQRGMMRLLSNADLVAQLMVQGSPIQVEVRLNEDSATPTGYEWSSSAGPDLEITSGTLAAGSVLLKRERPITLVIPKIRALIGI